MAEFEIAFEKTNAVEGGYTLRPNETWGGIDRKWHPDWPGWRLIDELRHQAGFPDNLDRNEILQLEKKKFFLANFWNKMRLSEIHNQAIANEIYDTGVNMGPEESVEFLQRAFNALSATTLLIDGVNGPKTLHAINGYSYVNTLLKCLNILQGYEYVKIVEANPSQKKFIRGWLCLRVWPGQ